MIPIDKCKHGYLYEIEARNFSFGVYNEKEQGFIGIRHKWGDEYLFTEIHYDADPLFGTAEPIREVCICPLDDISTINNSLFSWLREKERELILV